MSEIRVDLLHNQHVLIAPKRLHRPDFYQQNEVQKISKKDCPFCEGHENMTPPEIFAIRDNGANDIHWKTRVVPNLYKAVQVEQSEGSKRDGLFEQINGVGAHEVLIDSPFHDKDLSLFDTTFIELWLKTLIKRIEDLKNDKRLIYISIFKNFGQNSGATQEHPHTQLLALPLMPRSELDFLQKNLKYYKKHGRGKLQDIIENEKKSGERVIDENDDFMAYCPYASSFAFEVIIAPKRNISSLNHCSSKEVTNLSQMLESVFSKLHKQLGKFDYNLYFRLAPLNTNFENESFASSIEKNFRFNIRIIPRIYRIGGFELSSNMAINPVAPEMSAKLLREG